jgi:hypothetical protein
MRPSCRAPVERLLTAGGGTLLLKLGRASSTVPSEMRALWWLALLGLLSACSSSNLSPTPGPNTSAPRPSAAASPSAASDPAQEAVAQARHDAAQRLNVPETDVHVDSVEAHEWPDASRGCRRDGEVYAQVVTPGYIVVVSAHGQQLEYHADSIGRVLLCSGSQ